MKLAALTAAALTLAACASSDGAEGWNATTNAQRITWENNSTAWAITCGNGRVLDTAACYKRAAAVCPAGFKIARETLTDVVVLCKP